MHEIINHCGYLFCLKSLTFWFSLQKEQQKKAKKSFLLSCKLLGLHNLPLCCHYCLISQNLTVDPLGLGEENDVYRLTGIYPYLYRMWLDFCVMISMQNYGD